MKYEENQWYSVERDGSPPFDRRCLVRGRDIEYGFFVYALAFNQCYPPYMNMTQVFELLESEEKPCTEVPFEIEEYMLLEI